MGILINIYLFRGAQIGMLPATVWCAAPMVTVSATFGGGGFYGEQGLVAVFGGAALFRNGVDENILLGVWGARRCARFRRLLREAGHALTIKDLPADIRMAIRWG